MKNHRKILTALIIALSFMLNVLAVFAAEQVTITMKPDLVQEGDKEFNMTYNLSGGTAVTNGKLRITYDPEYLSFSKAVVGDMLKDTLTSINDPVNGNKKEGEIVFVFASTQAITADGEMLHLSFHLKDGIKQGSSFAMNIKAEELSLDQEEVEAVIVEEPVVVGEKETQTETTKQTNPPTGNGGGNTTTPGGNNSNQNTGGNTNGNTTTSTVKTGDDTNLFIPVLGCIAAAAILTIMIYMKRRTNKE